MLILLTAVLFPNHSPGAEFLGAFVVQVDESLVSCPSAYPWSDTVAAAAAAKSLQSCPTLCHPIDGSPPGSPVPGILQARTQ